ncbi:MAG: response regulator transcription factor [Burkholderiales bacterium]|nr:response regulator transcription factor [Burkholderiales bacterium]
MPRILLVDDDAELLAMLGEYLAPEGFEVETAADGESGVQRAVAGGFDVVVLDVMLPRLSGLEALRRLRQVSTVPVLMLTAKGDDVDRIVGLELGADDYLPKPFNPRELVARMRALLRRARAPAPDAGTKEREELRAGEVLVRPKERAATWRGEALELTSTEFNLLEALVRNAGRVLSKAELSEQVLGRSLTRYDRGIDMHVSNLRRKLGALADGRSPIQTVRGLGYQFIAS